MCRHAAAIGPGIHASELMCDLPHSLLHQSYQPRELLMGTVCADGFGLAWYDPDTRAEPARYASGAPIWSDANLASIAPLIRSRLVMGAVRTATVAGANIEANAAPFASGRYTWSHNGYIDGFGERWREWIRSETTAERARLVRGNTDSEHLFQAFLSRLDAAGPGGIGGGGGASGPSPPRGPNSPNTHGPGIGGAELASTLQSFCRDVARHAEEVGTKVQLNLLVSDGETLLATRCASVPTQNSLYLLQDGDEFPGSHVVASEPLYDDPEWEVIPPDTLLVLRAGAPPVRLRI